MFFTDAIKKFLNIFTKLHKKCRYMRSRGKTNTD